MYEWIDNTYSWTDTPSIAWCDGSLSSLRGLYTDDIYLYFISDIGLMIKDLISDEDIGYVRFKDGFTALAMSEDVIYLGTKNSGIVYLLKNLFNQDSNNIDLTKEILFYTQIYIHDSIFIRNLYYSNDVLSVVTSVGINIINNSLQGYKSTYNKINVQKSIITSKLNLYYSYIDDDDIFKVGKVINIKCDWDTPDIIYDSVIFDAGAIINDFKITVNTTNGNDTIFVATSNGVYIICSKTKQFIKYNIINYSNNVVSINVSKNASMVKGKLYITSSGEGGAVYKIVDITSLQTLDLYSFTFAGNAKTTLLSENLISSLLIGD